jgi:uncharacterized membrane protein YfcA
MSERALLVLPLIGLIVGIIGGMVGIGGGVLIIPILMIAFGFSQPLANGTSLAMLLPPIGIFAVIAYARAGYVEWRFAGLLAAGFAVGAYIGARLVSSGRINPTALRVMFALLLVYSAGRLLFRPGGRARAAIETTVLVSSFALAYGLGRLLGWRLQHHPRWSTIYHRRRHPVQHDYEI